MSNETPTEMLTEDVINAAAQKLGGACEFAYDDEGDLCGLAYFAQETRRWHAVDVEACRALLTAESYSLWCSDPAHSPAGDGDEAQTALDVAGWWSATEWHDKHNVQS